jgi:hypothetical protein
MAALIVHLDAALDHEEGAPGDADNRRLAANRGQEPRAQLG